MSPLDVLPKLLTDSEFWKDRLQCSCDKCNTALWVEIVPYERTIRYKYYCDRSSLFAMTVCYHCGIELGEFIAYRAGVQSIPPADFLPPLDTTENFL